jgi:hypothetical protein
MMRDDIDNSRRVCSVGIPPVKRADFVIFRIRQKTIDGQAWVGRRPGRATDRIGPDAASTSRPTGDTHSGAGGTSGPLLTQTASTPAPPPL